MAKQQQGYLSYLLRLWQTGNDSERIWRASLETPGSGERRGFASLRELFDFLEAQTVMQGSISNKKEGEYDEL
jgi:hypothetical protein